MSLPWKYIAKRFARRAYNWRCNFRSVGADNAHNIRALAEHRAELLKVQDDLLQAANREVAMEATIEQLGKDAATIATENDRLKAELAECEAALQLGREGIQAYCDSENAMRAKLDSAERHIRRYHWDAVYSILTGNTPNEAAREQLAMGATPSAAPSCTASAGSCNSPKSCGEAGSCIDARMREVVASPADLMGALKQAFAKKFEPAPPDYMWERPLTTRERLLDHERRLAALEAKGEPGTHAFDGATNDGGLLQREYCVECGKTRSDHRKGAKP